MNKLDLEYLGAERAQGLPYFKLPILLIQHEAFKGIDMESKVLYSLFLDRVGKSALPKNVNNFTDIDGKLYIIYTVEEIMEELSIAKGTAIKYIKQLEDIGLIIRKRQGQGNPAIIYVMDYSTVNFKESKKWTSRSPKSEPQEVQNLNLKKFNNQTSKSLKNELLEVQNLDTNHLNNNQLNNNHINSILSYQSSNDNCEINYSDYDEIRSDVKQQINFDLLKTEMPYEEMIDDIFEIMVEVVGSQKEYFRISGEKIPTFEFRKRIEKIGKEDIELFVERFNQQENSIQNIKAYLLKSLYNLPTTSNAYWNNKVRADRVNLHSRK